LGVYLNGYESVPTFLNDPKIVVKRSQIDGDQKDNGKFFFLSESKLKYFATADDDIEYPNDYVIRLLRYLRLSGGSGSVGVHGYLLPEEITSISSNRHVFHFADSAPFLTPVNVLGTGTTLFNQDKWKLRFSEFGEPGMSDVWFAIAAKRRAAPLWAIPRPHKWLNVIEQPESLEDADLRQNSLYDEFRGKDDAQVAALKAQGIKGSWSSFFEQLLSVEVNRKNFCLTQAMQISRMSEQLGWSPPDTVSIRKVEAQVQSANRGLLKSEAPVFSKRFSRRWLDSYSRFAVEFSLSKVTDPKSLDFVRQLPALAGSIEANTLPNCIKWDAREDRQKQLAAFIALRFLQGAVVRTSPLTLTMQTSLFYEYNYDQLIQLAACSVKSDFLAHPDLAALSKTNPLAALELSFRYLDALPKLTNADLPTLEQWLCTIPSDELQQQTLIAYAVLASKSGDLERALEVSRNVLARYGFSFELHLLGLRLGQLANVDSESLEDKLNALERQFGFSASAKGTFKKPMVSVVLSTYNQADELVATVQNILSASYQNLEILVVDDGSTDHTAKVLSGIQDSRVRVITSGENRGPYVSRNRAIKRARGELVSFHDCGDYSSTHRLEIQVQSLLQNESLQAVRTNHLRLDQNGTLRLENNLKFVGDAPVTMLVRKSVFTRLGGFLPTRSRGDIEFLRRLQTVYGAQALETIGFPFYIAGAPNNSVRYSSATVRKFMRSTDAWHKLIQQNESMLETWVIDELVPFDIPHELKAEPQ
jgi:hypothetical protein